MPANLTDVDTFTSPIVVPVGGDARTVSSIEPAFQALANRTLRLKNRVDTLAGSRTKLIPLSYCAIPDGLVGVQLRSIDAWTYLTWRFYANSVRLIIPIDLATGDIITNLELCVNQGNAGASGQMVAKVWRQAVSPSASPTKTQLGSTLTFATGTGFKASSIAISSNNTVDTNLYHYHAELIASALAGTTDDVFHWGKITYTAYGAP
jgi:hypothetical protein